MWAGERELHKAMIHKKITPATSDERGAISDILNNAEISHVGVVESKSAGVIRGNHYHKATTQHIFLTKGSLRYWFQPADKSQPVNSILVQEHEMVSIPPGEVHALEILEPNQFIEFCEGGSGDYESDTFRVPPILTTGMVKKEPASG
jgi:dTDP-4-dehydrorhamnose 3,5-epimerase-like enzyme